MSSAWLWLVPAGALAWLVLSGLGAREAANRAAMGICHANGLQLLDGTVAFASMRLIRARRGGWQIRRLFAFEFSNDGVARSGGLITVDGQRVVAVDLPPGDLSRRVH